MKKTARADEITMQSEHAGPQRKTEPKYTAQKKHALHLNINKGTHRGSKKLNNFDTKISLERSQKLEQTGNDKTKTYYN